MPTSACRAKYTHKCKIKTVNNWGQQSSAMLTDCTQFGTAQQMTSTRSIAFFNILFSQSWIIAVKFGRPSTIGGHTNLIPIGQHYDNTKIWDWM